LHLKNFIKLANLESDDALIVKEDFEDDESELKMLNVCYKKGITANKTKTPRIRKHTM